MKRNIPMELNFLQEAKNAEKATTMFEHFPWLKVRQTFCLLHIYLDYLQANTHYLTYILFSGTQSLLGTQ